MMYKWKQNRDADHCDYGTSDGPAVVPYFGTFDTEAQAKQKCVELGDECGGIIQPTCDTGGPGPTPSKFFVCKPGTFEYQQTQGCTSKKVIAEATESTPS